MSSVEEVLTRHGMNPARQGRRFVVRCINPDHEDKNPSLSIDSVTGLGYCFSCGYKFNVYTYFNESYNYQSQKIHFLRDKLESVKSDVVGLDMPDSFVPFNREFRGISSETMKRFEAFTVSNEDWSDRLVFPLRNAQGSIKAFIGRHMYSDEGAKYLIRPHKVKLPLFPAIVKPVKGCVVLVEGIFDTLNLIDKGVTNVVCAFGTNTFSSRKDNRLTQLKMMGISKILVLFDGDMAGRKASTELVRYIRGKELLADSIDLPDDVDPGSLSLEDVIRLKELIK